MNEIRYNLASSTMSQVVVAGLFSVMALSASPEKVSLLSGTHPFSPTTYSSDGSTPTFDSFRGGITGQYDHSPIQFEQVVGNFYARLLSSQEPLGAEFEKVLYDNLWDLYES
jgi:hypothetical protein